MLSAAAGGWVDEVHHLGFTTWRATCRISGLRFTSLVDFTLQLLPTAILGLLLGGLVVLAWGALARDRDSGLHLAAHASCALTLPLTLLLCASALPLPMMLLADLGITVLAAMLLWPLLRPASRSAPAHP
jgi:uncharacterized membrane protein (UPF0136 family)